MSMQQAIMTTESAFKTATASPVLNTDYIALRIDTDNGVYFRREPQFWGPVRSAHTRNRRERTGTERFLIRGNVSQVLHRVQAPLLIRWALQPVDQTPTPDLPWTTSVAAGHLGTAQFDGAHEQMDNGTMRRRLVNGAVCVSGRIEGNNQTDLIRYSANFIAATEGPSSFTAPAATDYPTSEYVFQDMWSGSGIFKVGSATTSVSSWAIDWTNFVTPQWYEASSIIEPRMMGRDINFTFTERLNSTPDRRTPFDARTAQDCEFTLHDGTGSVKFDFHARSFMESIQDSLPLQNEYTRTITASVFFDPAQGTDLTLTFA